MIMATVKFTIELVVQRHQLSDFKRIAREMNAIVRTDEPLTLQCQWFFHEGEDKWYLTETFPDSDAFLHHLANVAPQLGQLLEIAEVSRFEVFGELSLAAKATIASFGVKYFTLWEGVSREDLSTA
jgi:quinol monooxygenase YgiN